MFVLDGSPLAVDAPFSHDGVNYPGNWLRLSTPEERAALGIQEVADPLLWDPRFYFGVDQDGNPIPRDHSELVTEWETATKAAANNLLSPSDWLVVRSVDNGTAIPTDWQTWREQIRLETGTKLAAITATTTTQELAGYVTGLEYNSWAPDPDHPVVEDPIEVV